MLETSKLQASSLLHWTTSLGSGSVIESADHQTPPTMGEMLQQLGWIRALLANAGSILDS
jgi:hypothetical protein